MITRLDEVIQKCQRMADHFADGMNADAAKEWNECVEVLRRVAGIPAFDRFVITRQGPNHFRVVAHYENGDQCDMKESPVYLSEKDQMDIILSPVHFP